MQRSASNPVSPMYASITHINKIESQSCVKCIKDGKKNKHTAKVPQGFTPLCAKCSKFTKSDGQAVLAQAWVMVTQTQYEFMKLVDELGMGNDLFQQLQEKKAQIDLEIARYGMKATKEARKRSKSEPITESSYYRSNIKMFNQPDNYKKFKSNQPEPEPYSYDGDSMEDDDMGVDVDELVSGFNNVAIVDVPILG